MGKPGAFTIACDILTDLCGVTPAATNGTRGSLNHLLETPGEYADVPEIQPYVNCDYPEDPADRDAIHVATDCTCDNMDVSFSQSCQCGLQNRIQSGE